MGKPRNGHSHGTQHSKAPDQVWRLIKVKIIFFFSGNEALTGVIKGLLGNSMFLGGLVAVVLDNTVRGKHT